MWNAQNNFDNFLSFVHKRQLTMDIHFAFVSDSTGKVHHDLHNRDPAFLKYKYSYAYEDQSEWITFVLLVVCFLWYSIHTI